MTLTSAHIELLPEHESHQLEVRTFAEAKVAPRAAEIDRDERVPHELVSELCALGYLGSRLGLEHGGRNLDSVSYGLLHHELGRACSSTRSLVTVHDMVAESILRLGPSDMRASWLPLLAKGEAIAAFALTEPEAGSDASAVRTTAIRDGDDYLLTGHKQWISFAQLADVFLVVARLGEDGPIGGFLVRRDTPGLSVTPTAGLLGLRGSMLAELRLDECRVPVTARLGTERMPTGLVTATALQLGRYSVAWGCVGLADACWDECSRHTESRTQFGVPLAEHQLVLRMLTEMATNLRAARLLCLDAGSALAHREPRAIEATLMAKYFASRAATSIATDAVQLLGARGCSDLAPVERHFRDARVMEIIEGSTQIQQITIARHLRPRLSSSPEARESGAGESIPS
ncbi:acyl-CoA dehydrogenase family protein [soil metagenome]